jgi:hypothetical protein
MGKGKNFPNTKGGRKEAKVHEKRSGLTAYKKERRKNEKKGEQ